MLNDTSTLSPAERRILVVANETIDGAAFDEAIRREARHASLELLVVAPALNSRLRHWTSDEDAARRRAEGRLAGCLRRLDRAGIAAQGLVGDADPLQAIADALRTFHADRILISTHPQARSHWLARNIVERARELFGLPVSHVVAGGLGAPVATP